MALGDPYITVADWKAYVKIADAVDDNEIQDVIGSVSAEINTHTGRQFQDAATATARVYRTEDTGLIYVDDFHTTTGLIIKTDDDADGTYETTWTSDEYQLEPLNGIVEGVTGWPYWVVRAIDERQFPMAANGRALIQVTARWGWASVPKPVKQACRILASETFGLKDTKYGVAGFGDFGVVRVKDNPMAMSKLEPYCRTPVLGGEG